MIWPAENYISLLIKNQSLNLINKSTLVQALNCYYRTLF